MDMYVLNVLQVPVQDLRCSHKTCKFRLTALSVRAKQFLAMHRIAIHQPTDHEKSIAVSSAGLLCVQELENAVLDLQAQLGEAAQQAATQASVSRIRDGELAKLAAGAEAAQQAREACQQLLAQTAAHLRVRAPDCLQNPSQKINPWPALQVAG